MVVIIGSAPVEAEARGEIPGRQARKQSNDPEHQPLWTGDPKRILHSFRNALKTVLDRPQQPEEIEYSVQLISVGHMRRGWRHRCAR